MLLQFHDVIWAVTTRLRMYEAGLFPFLKKILLRVILQSALENSKRETLQTVKACMFTKIMVGLHTINNGCSRNITLYRGTNVKRIHVSKSFLN